MVVEYEPVLLVGVTAYQGARPEGLKYEKAGISIEVLVELVEEIVEIEEETEVPMKQAKAPIERG